MLLLLWAANALPAGAETVQITIDKLQYLPKDANAKVGDTVVWDNKDFVDHTATAVDGEWDAVVPAYKSASFVLKKAGSYDYYCRLHPNMKAHLNVAK